jgi:hypothetical protein
MMGDTPTLTIQVPIDENGPLAALARRLTPAAAAAPAADDTPPWHIDDEVEPSTGRPE